ncbi:MAG: hypothetical protein KDJ65_28665 [Anaerolineae bacterium]|nr:hypothetical protein [Anaerolineae bacterium]
MLWVIGGIFIILHGLVHLLYFGQSWRLFELQAGMSWPDGSWAFSQLLGDDVTRWLASISCIVAAIGFVAGGIALLLMQPWWQQVVVGSSAFSTLFFILFWDGKMQKLHDKGGIGVLINIGLVIAVLL